MPAYNVEKYISESISSVINQTYTNWELIVVDDGSTDATASIVKTYCKEDKRVKYLYQINSRQARARNYGIANAQGAIIAFLDADDLWLPDKLEKTLGYFDLDKYDLIFTNAYTTDSKTIDVYETSYDTMSIASYEYSGKEALRLFIEINRIPILTVLVKRMVIQEAGLFREEFVPAEDYDLWLRLLKMGKVFKSIDKPLSIYRIQENSSTAYDRWATRAVIKSIERNFNKLELIDLGVEKHLRKWILRWIDFYLSSNNISELKGYVSAFNFETNTINALFLFNKFTGFPRFKDLIKKKLQV